MVYDHAQKSFFDKDNSNGRRGQPYQWRPRPKPKLDDANIAAGPSCPPVQISKLVKDKLTSFVMPACDQAVVHQDAEVAVASEADTTKTPARQMTQTTQPVSDRLHTLMKSSQSDGVQWKCSPLNVEVHSTEKFTIDEVFDIYGDTPAPKVAQSPGRQRPSASPAGDLWSRFAAQQTLPFAGSELSPLPGRSPKLEAKTPLRRSTSLPVWSVDNGQRKKRRLNGHQVAQGQHPLRGMMDQVQASLVCEEMTDESPVRVPTQASEVSSAPTSPTKLAPQPMTSDDFSSDSIDELYLANLDKMDAVVHESLSASHSMATTAASLQKQSTTMSAVSDVLTDGQQADHSSEYDFDLGLDAAELEEATQQLDRHYKASQTIQAEVVTFDADKLLAGLDEDDFADFEDEDLNDMLDHDDVSIHTIISVESRLFDSDAKQRPELCVSLIDAQQCPKTALLRDDWVHTQLTPGEALRLHGTWQSPTVFIATNIHGLVIVNPDVLVSATSVADAHNCMRKAVLQDRVKATSQLSLPLLYGSMLHEILQQSLLATDFTDAAMRQVVDHEIAKHMESLYLLEHSVEEAKDYLYEKLMLMQQWAHKYVGDSKSAAAEPVRGQGTDRHRLHQVALGVKAVLEVEERFWSPIWGLKGNVDVTASMHVSVDGQQALHAAPLEFKTGNATKQQGSHRAQTMLYTLMMSDRYGIQVTSGYLYYLETSQITRVVALHNEVRGLLQMRNDVASFIKYKRLPGMLKNPFACKHCYASTACFTYHKAFDEGTGESSGLATIFDEKVGHLTPPQLAWFNKWEQLITKEEGDMFRFRHELWYLSSSEREKLQRCFGHLLVVPGSEQNCAQDGKMTQWSYDLARRTPGVSFMESQIAEKEPVVISDEHGHYALSCGFVTRMTATTITVQVDRPLRDTRRPLPDFHPQNNQAFQGPEVAVSQTNPVLYRLDRDEFKNGMAMVRNNLIQLLLPAESKQATVSTERLRNLFVDLVPPLFDKRPLTCPTRVSQSSLNVDQIRSKDKVMSARDYALILGMPGTGKTTTIATIIKSLVAAGKSVLLTSYTHSAVDTILLKLKTDVKILRLGVVNKIHPEVLGFASTEKHSLTTFEELERHYHEPSVVATTCLSINHNIFQKRRFDYCIVDEASQITLPFCLGPLRFADKFILVGDHFQLPPLVKNKEALEGGLDVSLFRLLSDAHPSAVVNLEHQYRMNADIMSIANELIYNGKLKCGTPEIAAQTLAVDLARVQNAIHPEMDGPHTPCWLEQVFESSRSVVYLNTDSIPDAGEKKRGDQTQNVVESRLISQMVAGLVAGGVAESSIGIISPYRSQLKVLQGDLRAHPGVMIDTADKFQGRDKDCILVSFVRSNTAGQVGDLLKDWRRINVALTRAKRKLICVGSQVTLAHDALLKRFLDLVHRKGWAMDLSADAAVQHEGACASDASGNQQASQSPAGSEVNKENRRAGDGRTKVVRAGKRVLFKEAERPILSDLSNAMQ